MANVLRELTREPIHPPTTHFPMALYPMAVIFDVLAMTRQDGALYTHAAFIVMITATVMAGIAMVTGFMHLMRDVSSDSRAWRVALLHMSLQLTAAGILLVSLLLRVGHVNDPRPPTLAVALAIIGTVVLLVGGWLGGRLVYYYAVGVRRHPAGLESTATGKR